MTDYIKNEIDNMDYESMVRKWRHSASGVPIFQGESGIYFGKIMEEKKKALSHDELVRISKSVGW